MKRYWRPIDMSWSIPIPFGTLIPELFSYYLIDRVLAKGWYFLDFVLTSLSLVNFALDFFLHHMIPDISNWKLIFFHTLFHIVVSSNSEGIKSRMIEVRVKKLSWQKIAKQFFVYFQENIKTSKQQDQKLLCTCYLGLTHDFTVEK